MHHTRLKYIRLVKAKKNQKEFAQAIGRRASVVCLWEKAKRVADMDDMAAIMAAFPVVKPHHFFEDFET